MTALQWMELTMMHYGIMVKGQGMSAASVRKAKAPTVKMQRVALIAKDR